MKKKKLPYKLQFFAERRTIFELVTSERIVSYWEDMRDDEEDLLGEELWGTEQKLGLGLEWIKGSMGLSVVLKPSAYDVRARKRGRIGFQTVSTKMPFFKEAMSIDEETRQQLNMVIETGNPVYVDSIQNRIFADDMQLLRGARAQRERMKMMLLTTGMISISANGQDYDYDYQMKPEQKVNASTPWKDKNASIIDDIRQWQDDRYDSTGVRPTRAVCSRKTFSYFTKNTEIRNGIHGNDAAAPVNERSVRSYLFEELDLEIVVYNKRYADEQGQLRRYIPDDLFVMLPEGKLGTSWFGTTPEQSDLMSGTNANVTITDVGVAVTTTKTTDPVSVEVKVSMINLPSFEAIDNIVIADVA